jgi:hypothetical protein
LGGHALVVQENVGFTLGTCWADRLTATCISSKARWNPGCQCMNQMGVFNNCLPMFTPKISWFLSLSSFSWFYSLTSPFWGVPNTLWTHFWPPHADPAGDGVDAAVEGVGASGAMW